MYFLRQGFAERGWGKLGRSLGILFAFCCIGGAIGGGNMFQANQAFSQFVEVTGGKDMSPFAESGWIFGGILAVVVAVVIVGGIQSIAAVAEKIVPLMAAVYILASLVVIGMHIDGLAAAFGKIISAAFSGEAAAGGVLGAIIAGVQRAAFSNEAGVGTAAIAHAPTKTDQPVSEGFIGMLGPVIDTMIICMLTGLVIVITGAYEDRTGMAGISLTSQAFEQGISWFPYVLALAVFLFAFSSILAWSYYATRAFTFLIGGRKTIPLLLFKLFFCVFVVIGAAINLKNVVAFTDALFFAMAVPNLIGLYVLAPSLKRDLKTYWAAYGKAKSRSDVSAL